MNKMINPVSNGRPYRASIDPRPYALGYSQGEFKRLEQQGALFRDLTEDVLRRAGIGPGMRVLDIGCGVGDVSILAAELVGPSGSVLGVDRSQEAVDTARRRAAASGQDWVQFRASELDLFASDETFDAVIGRLILMYLPEPTATLRRLRHLLRPGGIVAFQEIAMRQARSVPEGANFRRCVGYILDTFDRAGFELDMGGKLFATFLDAGLPAPRMIVSGRAEGGPHSPVYDFMVGTLRSLLPVTELVGVATAAEIDLDTMAEKLRTEAVAQRSCVMLPPLVGAWTRLPGDNRGR